MKLIIAFFFFLFLNINTNYLRAQSAGELNSVNEETLSEKDSTKAEQKNKKVNDSYNGNWSIGIGVNAVDDSGTLFKDLFNGQNYNTSNPYAAYIEYYANNMFSYQLMLSLNEYIAGKNVDNTGYIIEGYEASYMAIDFAFKWYWREFLNNTRFDPYMFLGFGYTIIGAYKLEPFPIQTHEDLSHLEVDEDGNFVVPEIGRFTVNTGIGFNIWFTRIWAINFNIAAKIGIGSGEYKRASNSVSHQMQYTVGTHFLLN